jgi:hypothetical protein
VYDLPLIEQAIKWMHAVCGYPVKSTWIKAVKAGNFIGWQLLNEKNIAKYYPETDEMPKGHMNQNYAAKRSKTSLSRPTTSERPSSQIKQENIRPSRNEETSI